MVKIVPFETFKRDCENYYEEDFSKIDVSTEEVQFMIIELYEHEKFDLDFEHKCIILN